MTNDVDRTILLIISYVLDYFDSCWLPGDGYLIRLAHNGRVRLSAFLPLWKSRSLGFKFGSMFGRRLLIASYAIDVWYGPDIVQAKIWASVFVH